jgi:hypothetical protein
MVLLPSVVPVTNVSAPTQDSELLVKNLLNQSTVKKTPLTLTALAEMLLPLSLALRANIMKILMVP